MSDNCACLYGGFDDFDETGFQHTEIRKSRKPRICVECRQTIPVGARYERYTCKFDGVISTSITCVVCQEIRGALYCDGFFFGRLWSDIKSQLFPQFSVKCIDQLTTVAAKTRLQSEYQTWLGLSST